MDASNRVCQQIWKGKVYHSSAYICRVCCSCEPFSNDYLESPSPASPPLASPISLLGSRVRKYTIPVANPPSPLIYYLSLKLHVCKAPIQSISPTPPLASAPRHIYTQYFNAAFFFLYEKDSRSVFSIHSKYSVTPNKTWYMVPGGTKKLSLAKAHFARKPKGTYPAA